MSQQSIDFFTSFIDDLDWPDVTKLSDKRKQSRLSRSLLIVVQPLNQDFRNVGELLQAVTCDTSSGGMGFICKDRIQLEYMRISLPGSRASVLAQLRHSRMVGGVPPVFQYGVEYLPVPAKDTTTNDQPQTLDLDLIAGTVVK